MINYNILFYIRLLLYRIEKIVGCVPVAKISAANIVTAGHIVLGMTDAPLLIRPYRIIPWSAQLINDMAKSELFTIMCFGFSFLYPYWLVTYYLVESHVALELRQ